VINGKLLKDTIFKMSEETTIHFLIKTVHVLLKYVLPCMFQVEKGGSVFLDNKAKIEAGL
jgi:hypothetical protein